MISEEDLKNFSEDFLNIEKEIGNVIIGQKDVIRDVLICIIAGGNALLEGLPGLGKTQLVKTIGKVLDLNFSRIQFTPDLMPSDVTGTDIMIKDISGNNSFKFEKGPIFSNIVLADEINRATPKTQSSLLEAMQEKTVTVRNITYNLQEPFFVLATQNPIELEGTYPLPEAQLDRFLFKINVDFPSQSELLEIVELTTSVNSYEAKKICSAEKILNMRNCAKQIPVAKPVAEFAANLILKAHPENSESSEISKTYISYGPSPRGAQAVITAAKITALLDKRFNVSFEDIKKVAYPALRHRIILNFEALSEKISADFIISKLLEECLKDDI